MPLCSITPARTFSYAAVEQYSPRTPHGTGQGEGILLCVITLGQLEAPKRAEAVEQVQDEGHHVDRQPHEDPQGVLEGLQE